MPELKLKTRYKAAGDVFNALLGIGFDPETASSFLNDINDADVVEVVHGRWIFEHDPIKDPKKYFVRIVCSCCGLKTGQVSNFCPKCGAKMDGKRKEQNNGN